jgi:biopolymer transport protein ExbD
MKHRILLAVLAVGLGSALFADESRTYAAVSLCGPGGGTNPIKRSEYIVLVVEGPNLFFETTPVPSGHVVEYVNNLLTAKNVSYIGVYAREGTKYGEVINAIDQLRATNAKNIGVSMTELPFGREP